MNQTSAWREEYRRTLKPLETEEPLDLLVYRPLAFVLAKGLARTPATADLVSLFSLGFGLLTGVLLWQGTATLAVFAAGSYFLCNVFDCADGQLARMKGTSSPLGYILDGLIDYLSTIAVFIGMAHFQALQHPRSAAFWWVVAAASGCAYGCQCAYLDRRRHEWMSRVKRSRSDPGKEMVEFRRQAGIWRAEGSHLGSRVLIGLYLSYMTSWSRILPAGTPVPAAFEAEDPDWAERNRPVLRMAAMMGSTTQMTLIMVAAIVGRIDVYLWMPLTLFNLWLAAAFLVQRRVSRTPPAAGAG